MAFQQIQFRRDTAARWAQVNPVLAAGEPGVETDTGKYKIGTGVTPWSQLGYKGEMGVPGPAGSPGPAGPQGERGPSGSKGEQGVAGAAGPATTISIGTVSSGFTASASITGLAPSQVLSLVLPKGDKGDKGDPGQDGARGSDGRDGVAGKDGAQGPKGDKGDRGETGAAGPQGPKGDAAGVVIRGKATQWPPATTAEAGDIYIMPNPVPSGTPAGFSPGDAAVWDGDSWENAGPIQGPKGEQGPKGDPGDDGARGADGAPGVNGKDGAPGAKGDPGPQGLKGDKGDKGDSGAQGNPGPANTLKVGTVQSTAPGTAPTVQITGAAPSQTVSFTFPGPATPTFQVGTVESGEPPAVWITNDTGVPSEYFLNFRLPNPGVTHLTSFYQNPQDMTVSEGGEYRFSAAANSTEYPIIYSWQMSIDEGKSWSDIDGSGSDSLTGTAALSLDGALFRCAAATPTLGRNYSTIARLTVQMVSVGGFTWKYVPQPDPYNGNPNYLFSVDAALNTETGQNTLFPTRLRPLLPGYMVKVGRLYSATHYSKDGLTWEPLRNLTNDIAIDGFVPNRLDTVTGGLMMWKSNSTNNTQWRYHFISANGVTWQKVAWPQISSLETAFTGLSPYSANGYPVARSASGEGDITWVYRNRITYRCNPGVPEDGSSLYCYNAVDRELYTVDGRTYTVKNVAKSTGRIYAVGSQTYYETIDDPLIPFSMFYEEAGPDSRRVVALTEASRGWENDDSVGFVSRFGTKGAPLSIGNSRILHLTEGWLKDLYPDEKVWVAVTDESYWVLSQFGIQNQPTEIKKDPGFAFNYVTYFNGLWVAFPSDDPSSYYTSTDLKSWQRKNFSPPDSYPGDWYGVGRPVVFNNKLILPILALPPGQLDNFYHVGHLYADGTLDPVDPVDPIDPVDPPAPTINLSWTTKTFDATKKAFSTEAIRFPYNETNGLFEPEDDSNPYRLRPSLVLDRDFLRAADAYTRDGIAWEEATGVPADFRPSTMYRFSGSGTILIARHFADLTEGDSLVYRRYLRSVDEGKTFTTFDPQVGQVGMPFRTDGRAAFEQVGSELIVQSPMKRTNGQYEIARARTFDGLTWTLLSPAAPGSNSFPSHTWFRSRFWHNASPSGYGGVNVAAEMSAGKVIGGVGNNSFLPSGKIVHDSFPYTAWGAGAVGIVCEDSYLLVRETDYQTISKTPGPPSFRQVCYGGGWFMAVHPDPLINDKVWVSKDLLSWTEKSVTVASGLTLGKPVFYKKRFYIPAIGSGLGAPLVSVLMTQEFP